MYFNILLSDEDVSLAPMLDEHFDILYQVAKDPQIWQMHFDSQRYQKDKFHNYFQSGINNPEGSYLVLYKDEVVGSTRYYEYDAENSSIKIGYTFYATKYWGTDLNRKVKNLMLDYAFEFVENIFFDIWDKNYRSQKAVKKLGARYFDKIIAKEKVVYQLTKKD